METKQRSSQSFCGRPGCGIAKTLHGYSAAACSNFIQPGSKEANALRREAPKSCPRCGGRTDGVKPESTMRGMVQAACDCREAPTVVGSGPVDSSLLDRVLMAGALEHLQARIARATRCLKAGLHFQGIGCPNVATGYFADALKALGDLGAE